METECWLYTFLVCAVHVRWALSLGRVRDVEKIQSHGAVMSVAAQNQHGEMDSKLIHVPSANTWGPSPAGRGRESRDARDAPACPPDPGNAHTCQMYISRVCGPVAELRIPKHKYDGCEIQHRLRLKYAGVSHVAHMPGAERAEIQMSPPALLCT